MFMQFDKTRFKQLCKSHRLGQNLRYFSEIDSTNRFLLKNSADLPPYSVALTDFQSKGRGRLQRTWVAPYATSLLVSVLLRPAFPAIWLTMLAGLAAVKTIQENCALNAALKWPNDVMLQQADGTWHKTGGILTEVQSIGEESIAVVGMGLNVNIVAEDLPAAVTPATSLRVMLGQAVDREQLLADWLLALEAGLVSAENQVSPHPQWQLQLITLNQPVIVSGAIDIEGTAEATDEWGRLLVRDQNGDLHKVAAADVTLRKNRSSNNRG